MTEKSLAILASMLLAYFAIVELSSVAHHTLDARVRTRALEIQYWASQPLLDYAP